MKKYTVFILLVFLSLSVIACQPDPRKEADAYATRMKADQDALNQQLNREQSTGMYALEVQRLQVEQGHREATAQEWRNGLNNLIRWAFLFGTAAVCFVIFLGSRSVITAFATATQGLSQAMVRKADVRANLIQLDPVTRQYPLFIQYIGAGRYAAYNPNVNSLTLLDTRSEPDRQMIVASGSVQYVGVLAREAGKSADPAGVSVVKQPIIDVTGEMVTLARELARKDET